MPYDSLKARKAINTARAYERFPGSEFVMEMSVILKDADEEIKAHADRLRSAESEARRHQIEADQARADYKLLRETSAANYERVVLALKDIASSPKGGKTKAVDTLKAIGIELPSAVKPSTSAS